MTFIAIDDEPLALVLIERLARNLPNWQLLASFTDAHAALAYLAQNAVDLLLSDINMPDLNGLDLVKQLPQERPLVIFLTAYKEHALDGFELEVVDYLVKPVSPDRFSKAFAKAANLLELREKALQAPPPVLDDHFFVYAEYQQIKIVIRDILYIESMGDYVKIHLANQAKPVLTLARIKNLSDQLQVHGLRRVHRSFIVNMSRVEARQKHQIRIQDTWIPLGAAYLE